MPPQKLLLRCLIMKKVTRLSWLSVAVVLCSVMLLLASTALVYLGANLISAHAMDSLYFLPWLYKV